MPGSIPTPAYGILTAVASSAQAVWYLDVHEETDGAACTTSFMCLPLRGGQVPDIPGLSRVGYPI